MVGRIIASCITDCGRVREKNEDNLYFDGRCMEQEHRKLDKAVTICRETREASFFGVFDGVGGESFGEVASYLAAAGLHHARQGYDPARQGIEEFLEAVCRMVNGRICREAQERKVRGMGSTAAILAFYASAIWGTAPFSGIGRAFWRPSIRSTPTEAFSGSRGLMTASRP